jgi:hypothetical protein
LNADSGKAVWASFDARPDEWTGQFFSHGARFRPLTDLIPTAAAPFLQSDAPAAQLPPPELALLEDRTEGDARLLRLRVTSPRGAEIVSLYPDAKTEVVGAAVNGKKVDLARGPWSLQYYALPPQGAEVALAVKANGPVAIRVTDRSYGLPQVPGVTLKPRPDYMILPPGSTSDMTMVGKAFSF